MTVINHFLNLYGSSLQITEEGILTSLALHSLQNFLRRVKRRLAGGNNENFEQALPSILLRRKAVNYFLSPKKKTKFLIVFDCKNLTAFTKAEDEFFPRAAAFVNLKHSLLICGGIRKLPGGTPQSTITNRAQLYYHDRKPNPVSPMLERRTAHAACSLSQHQEVVAVAGYTPTYKATGSCEILSQPKGKWRALPKQVNKKDSPGLSCLNGTQLYCFGGWIKQKKHLPNIEYLNVASLRGGWKILSIELIHRDNHMGIAKIANNQLLIFGGENKKNDCVFEIGRQPLQLETRIDYDTLKQGNCFKAFEGSVVAVDQKIQIQIYRNKKWIEC